MAKNASGYSIGAKDVPTILGMSNRGDRDHDIAAWFGVNQGRIAEAKDGKWGSPAPAAQAALPPKGPPGIKGRRLRGSVETALKVLATNPAQATKILQDAIAVYDKNES